MKFSKSDFVKLGAVGCLTILAALAGLLVLSIVIGNQIFPGSQFQYSSKSTRPKKIALSIDPTIDVWVPRDDISAIYSGEHGTTALLDLQLYLPDLIPEKQYDAAHPGVLSGNDAAIQQQFHDQLTIELTSADYPSDANGQNKELVDWLNEFRPVSRVLRDNPYKNYDAYILSDDDGDTTALEKLDSINTVYVPHGPVSYYILCLGQLMPGADCDLIYIYDSKVKVDVTFTASQIDQVSSIKDKVNRFLSRLKYSPKFYGRHK